MGNERRPADGASLHAVPVVNLRFQRLVQRQDRPAEPLAADGECDHLRAGAGVTIVQRKAVAAVTVAALPAYQAAGPFPLRRGHAVGGAVRPVLQRRQMLIGFFFHTVPPFFFSVAVLPERASRIGTLPNYGTKCPIPCSWRRFSCRAGLFGRSFIFQGAAHR